MRLLEYCGKRLCVAASNVKSVFICVFSGGFSADAVSTSFGIYLVT